MNCGTKPVTVSTATGFVLCMFPQTAASFIKVYTDVLLSTRNLLPATAQERLLPWAFEIRETAQPEHMPSLAAARCQTADSASHFTKPLWHPRMRSASTKHDIAAHFQTSCSAPGLHSQSLVSGNFNQRKTLTDGYSLEQKRNSSFNHKITATNCSLKTPLQYPLVDRFPFILWFGQLFSIWPQFLNLALRMRNFSHR